jgi:threonine/homoserine/homoserine lactone efflux protein
MNILLLGFGIGALSLIAPGPINLALVQVGARLGRRPALRGAAGVVGGDSVLGVLAVLIVSLGTALPARAFTTAQFAAALLLAAIGFTLVAKPLVVADSIERMRRPGRTFFVLTSCAPTALAGWVAMLAAMPFANQPAQLAVFAGGVLIASYLWHPTLGIAASAVGERLTEGGQRRLSQAGGLSMVVLAVGLVVNQLL